MRLAPLLCTAMLLSTPVLAQEAAEWDWPEPQISSDISALPPAVQEKRAALIEAARSGDIEALRPIIDAQKSRPNVSFGAPDDPVAFLKDVSEDDEGRQILGLMLDLFDQPYAYYPDSGGETYYIWPYLSELDPNNLTAEQTVDAYRLIDSEGIEELKQFGGWYYWRLHISESGEWSAFVAGD
ncbi:MULTISPECIES: hypothetical protein [Devosia]|mgnify:CR=1 FL=1|uniref:Uncharacterized protein n=1 Tax=Devosia equisanguinis TaxID=2490941 RepID=A0A3S4CAU0_9HYPH|nr:MULTISPECIES: hypothetical protein [Devosia]ODU86124.1 MAG: hypothetical protein ABT14_10040 [Pelagibacterium sp. SCN 63-17]VDS04020.1 hypothetical protein DEVEQU_01151 [Devosia equisanguinis]